MPGHLCRAKHRAQQNRARAAAATDATNAICLRHYSAQQRGSHGLFQLLHRGYCDMSLASEYTATDQPCYFH